MKTLIIYFVLLTSFSLVDEVKNQSESIQEFLLTRKFTYWMGTSMAYENNVEVHGKNVVYREIDFLNDTLFQETIFNEMKFYDNFLNDSSGFVPMKDGYEVSVLFGSWKLESDSIVVLQYRTENIYDFGAYQRFCYELNEPSKLRELPELRNRSWTQTKSLLFNKDRSLSQVTGLSRCFAPDY